MNVQVTSLSHLKINQDFFSKMTKPEAIGSHCLHESPNFKTFDLLHSHEGHDWTPKQCLHKGLLYTFDLHCQ